MDKEEWKEKVSKALLKVAQGCSVAEVVEEYVEVDGTLKLTKRKKTKKEIPPDLKALQLLLEERAGTVQEMSDEELAAEKERLLKMLAGQTEQTEQTEQTGQTEQSEQSGQPPEKKKRGRPMKRVRKKALAGQ